MGRLGLEGSPVLGREGKGSWQLGLGEGHVGLLERGGQGGRWSGANPGELTALVTSGGLEKPERGGISFVNVREGAAVQVQPAPEASLLLSPKSCSS